MATRKDLTELMPSDGTDCCGGNRTLLTPAGDKSLYHAVSQCSRCGFCLQICPSYSVSGREDFSPRGRNQLVRKLIEGTLSFSPGTAAALDSCLLCGSCSTVCFAGIPTSDIVLEAVRALNGKRRGSMVYQAVRLMLKHRRIFSLLLGFLFLLRRCGAVSLAEASGLFRLPGMAVPGAVLNGVKKPPLRFAAARLKKKAAGAPPGRPAWVYFLPCGTDFLFPSAAEATWRLLNRHFGPGLLIAESCCGMLSHNYGDLEAARECAIKNILIFEKLSAEGNPPLLVADCASCAGFMKNYEKLFSGDSGWRKRASVFSAAVRDMMEMLPAEKVKLDPDFRPSGNVVYHDSCAFRRSRKAGTEAAAAVRKLAGVAWREADGNSGCCGGAGAWRLINPAISDSLLKEKIISIASAQAGIVVTGDTYCLLQINSGLKKTYPAAEAVHYSVFADSAEKKEEVKP